MKKSLMALAFGTFGLGVAEFVMMAILPYVAAEMRVSIPSAGNLISAYALGVCLGAPALTLARRRPLKHLLLVLVALMVTGNLMAALAPGYWVLMAARLLSGLPHGAYFGVASIVASRLAPEGKGAMAVSAMVSGMTVANLAGVPLSTFVAHILTWRMAFLFVGVWGCVVWWSIWRLVPHVQGLEPSTFKSQFRFLRSPAPWLIIAATLLGNGGVFCWYSYVNPMLTQVAGFDEGSVSLLMVLAGGGMVVGNVLGGLLSDRIGPGRVDKYIQTMLCMCLLGMFFLAAYPWAAVLLMCLCTMGLFGVSSPQQFLILKYSKGGELLGGACIQVAFNLGNAVGAWCGGLPVRAGLSYNYPSLVGAFFVMAGVGVLTCFCRRYEPAAGKC